jgi:hypothetical protein
MSPEDLLGPGWVLGSSTPDPKVLVQINPLRPTGPAPTSPGSTASEATTLRPGPNGDGRATRWLLAGH